MYFVFGTRLFGKVDAVPGLFHVATKCYHINYLPLIPQGGVLVFSQTGNKWKGVNIPTSLKSLGVAWTRVLMIVGVTLGIVGIILMSISLRDETGPYLIGIGIPCVFILVLTYTLPFFKRASWERACQLGKLAQLTESGWQTLGKAYGREIPPGGIAHGFPVSPVNTTSPG